jgi:predicted ABC-type ATPase
MSKKQPTIYIIAGCNGAGKTTFAREFLPREVKCLRFLNADEIARGLSPFDPAGGALRAGRILLSEFRASIERRETFAFESTLSGRTYVGLLRQALDLGFRIHLHYLWLPNVRMAIARVRERVIKGGHHVPTADVRRRFTRSLLHLATNYAPLAEQWAVWDNQTSPPVLMAQSASCSPAQLQSILRAS